MVATLDTNVLISGTLFGGVPGAIVDAGDPADHASNRLRRRVSGAGVIVSGGVHLTDLGQAAGVPIVTPARLVEMIG